MPIYHAKLQYGDEVHYWWNLSRSAVVSELLVPFVNGQVVDINFHGGHALLNMKDANLLRIYKTREEIDFKPSRLGDSPTEIFRSESFAASECTHELLDEIRVLQANPGITSTLQKTLVPREDHVFVIMKFGDRVLDSAYLGAIKPVIESYGLKALRIDEVQDSGRITDQALEAIARSKYVLADLSGERPNCYYEAGFAHALGRNLILTIRKSDVIHFDLAAYRFIVWETEEDLRRSLRSRFEASTDSTLLPNSSSIGRAKVRRSTRR